MDIQIILVFILALLTVNLIVVGVYVVLVLKEFRETVKKANSILSDVGSLSHTISSPITMLVGVATALIQGFKVTKSIRTLSDIHSDDEDED